MSGSSKNSGAKIKKIRFGYCSQKLSKDGAAMSVTLDLATCIELNGKIERYQSKGDDDVDKLLDILSALQEADAKGKLQVSMLRRCCSAPCIPHATAVF